MRRDLGKELQPGAYFLINLSDGHLILWNYRLPNLNVHSRAVILFKTSGGLQNKPYGPAFYLPSPVKIQVLLVANF